MKSQVFLFPKHSKAKKHIKKQLKLYQETVSKLLSELNNKSL